jgi:hypothetical protein
MIMMQHWQFTVQEIKTYTRCLYIFLKFLMLSISIFVKALTSSVFELSTGILDEKPEYSPTMLMENLIHNSCSLYCTESEKHLPEYQLEDFAEYFEMHRLLIFHLFSLYPPHQL